MHRTILGPGKLMRAWRVCDQELAGWLPLGGVEQAIDYDVASFGGMVGEEGVSGSYVRSGR